MATTTFTDGFPCDPAAGNFSIHEIIDRELKNCDARWPHAPMGQLFPLASAASSKEHDAWIPAAMERVEWHCTSADHPAAQWLEYLTCFMRMLVPPGAQRKIKLDDATLLRMAKFGPRLHLNRGGAAHFHDLAPLVARALAARKQPISPELATALDDLVQHLLSVHDLSPSALEISFRLFRSGYARIAWADPKEMDRPGWSALLDLADHNPRSSDLTLKDAEKLKNAVVAAGEDRVAAFISRTVESIQASQPAPLSVAGMTLLRQMMRWAQVDPALAIDDVLLRLSSVTWDNAALENGLIGAWLGVLLKVLIQRGRERGFACVERLANNPSTKDFREVVLLYEQLMHEMVREAPIGPASAVDGFAAKDDRRRRFHEILDSFLRASMPREYEPGQKVIQAITTGSSGHFALALQQAGNDIPEFLRAMNERTRWLAAQQPPESRRAMPWLSWCCDMGRLYCAVLERKPELQIADLIETCAVDSLGWLGVAPSGSLFAACQAWVAKNGFHPELSAAMAAWTKKIQNGASTMALKKDIGWLLWFDTTSPINEKACWSSVIRKDLRSMMPEQRAAWIALLSNVCSAIVEQPTKKWLKPAEGLLKQIDAADFRTRVRAWFEPFRSGGELRITLPARDILLALMWYSQLAKDPQVDEAVRWFATAKWKSKADRDRTARLLPIWIHTMSERCPEHAIDAIHAYKAAGQLELFGTSVKLYQDLCKRYGAEPKIEEPLPPPPVDRDALMDQMMARAMKGLGGLFGGSVPALGGETMEVTDPGGERYQVSLRDGRIVRLSDKKIVRLEIDWSRPPFGPFKQMIDGPDISNPFGKNYFRAMLCAQVLSGAIHTPVRIVEDES